MSKPKTEDAQAEVGSWMFLSNHAHVLVSLARDPDARLRDIAEQVGITERCVFNIVTDLEAVGAVRRVKEGRRNHYEIDVHVRLRHPLESHTSVGELLAIVLSPKEAERLGLHKP